MFSSSIHAARYAALTAVTLVVAYGCGSKASDTGFITDDPTPASTATPADPLPSHTPAATATAPAPARTPRPAGTDRASAERAALRVAEGEVFAAPGSPDTSVACQLAGNTWVCDATVALAPQFGDGTCTLLISVARGHAGVTDSSDCDDKTKTGDSRAAAEQAALELAESYPDMDADATIDASQVSCEASGSEWQCRAAVPLASGETCELGISVAAGVTGESASVADASDCEAKSGA
jgi:hypothetical protein